MQLIKCNSCGYILKDKRDELFHLYRKHPEYLMSISILESHLNLEPAIIIKTPIEGTMNLYKVMYAIKHHQTGNYMTVGTICLDTWSKCNLYLGELINSFNELMPLISDSIVKSLSPRVVKLSSDEWRMNDYVIPYMDMDNYEHLGIHLFNTKNIAI